MIRFDTLEMTEDDIEYIRAYIDNAVGAVAAKWVGKPLGPLESIAYDDYEGEDIITIHDQVCLLLLRRLGKDVGLLLENNNLGAYLGARLTFLKHLRYYEDVETRALFDSYIVLCAVLTTIGDAINSI